MNKHACGTLNDRLHHQRREFVGSLTKFSPQSLERGRSIRASWRGYGNAPNQEWSENSMKNVDTADPTRAECIAVVRLTESKKSLLG